ncbi:hypothetical protein ACUR5C_08725 [Aliikangiella sp. IMCC44653]
MSADKHGANRYKFAVLHFVSYQFSPQYETFKEQSEKKLFQADCTKVA